MGRHIGGLCLALVVLAVGCVSLPVSEESTSGETPPTPSNWTSGERADVPPEPRSYLTIGNEHDLHSNSKPHTYVLGNNHLEPRTAQLTVWRDSTIAMNRSVSFQADSSIEITAYRAGSYTIVVDLENGSRHVIADPLDDKWDCNEGELKVELRPDGEIDVTWFRTEIGCG